MAAVGPRCDPTDQWGGRGVLWRVVYGHGSKELTGFSAGPWHPDKAHAERWAAWLRAHGQQAHVQSNSQAGSRLLGGKAGLD